MALFPLLAAAAAAAYAAPGNHTKYKMNLPFSWATLPRYTFCGNETANFTGFPLRDSAVDYISTKGGLINLIGDHSSYRYPAETTVAEQARTMLAKNPAQRQWAYYAIDLVRTTYETGAYMMNHSDECLFKDASGVPVPRPVYGFDGGAGSCGVEKWLEGVQRMVEKGNITGIFLDGFQGCDPFFPRNKDGSFGVGCTRICGHHTLANGSKTPVNCTAASLAAWNRGLREAMWRLKRLLGVNGTLICNSTPGPYTCGNAADPITECPCDGTNDERGGGNFEHMEFVDAIDARAGPYAMLTHTPHADIVGNFKHSVSNFLMAASEYQYLGSGFGYGCDDGWLSEAPEVLHSFSAPLGAPLGPATASAGCPKGRKPPPKGEGPCIRSRHFASGTKVFINYTAGSSCIVWSDGVNMSSSKGSPKDPECVDGCAAASSYQW
eukprot:SAG22_NODE_8_length_37215_cov_120.960351_24_plen_437_part_00